MKNSINDKDLIVKHSSKMGGVFSIADLAVLMAEPHKNELYRRIRRLGSFGVLRRFSRGFYLAQPFNIEYLSQRLCPDSYISFGRVLSKHLVIGKKPQYQIDAVKGGKGRTYQSDSVVIRHFGGSENIYFGYESIGGIKIAKPEKALLDTLYYYQRGISFYFDIFSDVDVTTLDARVVDKFLSRYRNPKFTSFVRSYFNEISKR